MSDYTHCTASADLEIFSVTDNKIQKVKLKFTRHHCRNHGERSGLVPHFCLGSFQYGNLCKSTDFLEGDRVNPKALAPLAFQVQKIF